MSGTRDISRKRPVWIWIISIFFLLSACWSLLSFYLIWSGTIPLALPQKVYFDQLTVIDYGASIVVGALNIAGAIALFLLRKIAFSLFLSALILNIVVALWHTAAKGWTEALGGPGLVGVLIGYALLLAVCVYARHLSKKGVLR